MEALNRDLRFGKQADDIAAVDPVENFARSVDRSNNQNLQNNAMRDIGVAGLATLGLGAASRGAFGLYNVLARNRARKRKSGPALLPLPYPAKTAGWLGNLFSGRDASTESGIPWFGPAMLGATVGGGAIGWGGVDAALNSRRKTERQDELEKARKNFHDALLSSYDAPAALGDGQQAKAASDADMKKAGEALDAAWEKCAAVLEAGREKRAFDLPNAAGQALGGYGTYAGLSALLSGAVVYNQMKKRSRQSVLENAIKKRDQRRFMQSPTEIYAVPKPIPVEPENEEKVASVDWLALLTGKAAVVPFGG